MSGVNRVILVGCLTSTPKTVDGVVRLELSTESSWRDQAGMFRHQKDGHVIMAMPGMSGAESLVKGCCIYVAGGLRTVGCQLCVIADELRVLALSIPPCGSKYHYAKYGQRGA